MAFRRNPRFTRRQVLTGMGVSAAVAPFVPLLESAAGGGEQAPKRLILFFQPHGTIKAHWRPTGSPDDPVLSPILSPLQAFKNRLNIIEGLDIIPQEPFGGPHTVGPAYLFTGSRMLKGNEFQHQSSGGPHGWGSSISIEQAVAAEQDTLLPSLEFGVQTGGGHPGSRISYLGPGQPLAPERDPQIMFESLFGDSNLDLAEQQRLQTERLAVIDMVKPELDALQSKVSQNDRLKIEAHLAGIEQIENKVSTLYQCDDVDVSIEHDPNDFAAMEGISTQQIDMMVEAMACGLTNVASIMYRRGENDAQPYPFLPGIDPNEEHHLSTHEWESDPVKEAMLVEIYTWYATQLAYLAQKLDSIDDPQGGTMLDNSLIVWGTEIAKGNTHEWNNMPFVLLGGAGGSVVGNKYFDFGGQPHNRLLTTIGQAMGLDIQSFGDLDPVGGNLPELLT